MVDLAARLADMIDVPSTTGDEDAYGEVVTTLLMEAGYDVGRQRVEDGRHNLLATRGSPRVLLSTHIDTVPPHIPPRREGNRVFGRGACDTKGIQLAMLEAAGRIDGPEADDLGFLFVVGEEVDHCGARAALELELPDLEAIVLGEPTTNLMATSHKGVLSAVLRARGRAAHSGYPEEGESAILHLLDALERLRSLEWPSDPARGETTLNIGTLAGGLAPNVLAPSASACLLFRLVGDPAEVEGRLREALGRGPGEVEVEVKSAVGPVDLAVLDGFESTVVRFNSDAGILSGLAPVHLMGPGDIRVAHTDEEHIDLGDLARGADLYERAVRTLLERTAPRPT